MELLADICLDAFLDSVRLIPFLLITYLLMEWIEHMAGHRFQDAVRRAGVAGPAVGGLLGVLPQCGFSAAASTLYAGRVITLGTLYAVFLSTSDEMLPIFIAEQAPAQTIVAVLVSKLVIGMIMGFAIDAVMRARHKSDEPLRIHELCQRDKCVCNEECETCMNHPEMVYDHHDDCGAHCTHEHHSHDHNHDAQHGFLRILKSACKHTVEVTVFIFIVSLALNGILEAVGEDALASFMASNEAFSVVFASIVGLIPNCSASVAIAQLYLEGVLGAGAMMGGLLVSAGIGLLVLVRTNRPMKENALIVLGLLLMGIVWGALFSMLGITF